MRTGVVLPLCLALSALPGLACAQAVPPVQEPTRSTGKATEKQILEKLDKMIKQVEVQKDVGVPAVPPPPQTKPGPSPTERVNPVPLPPTSTIPPPPAEKAIDPLTPSAPKQLGASLPSPAAPVGQPLPPAQVPTPTPPQPPGPPPAHVRIRNLLNNTTALDISAPNFTEAVKLLRDRTGVQFVLEPTVSVNAPVVIKSTGVSLRTALNGVLTRYRLGYVVVGETVLITDEQEAAGLRLRQLVQVEANGQPLRDVLRQLSNDTGVNVVLDPRLRSSKAGDEKITLNVQEVAVHNAARLLAEFANLKAVTVGTVLVITTPENAARMTQENPPAVVPATAVGRLNTY